MRTALTLAAVVTVVLVLVGLPNVRQQASALLASLAPTPAPTLAPGSDLFYLLPNPPGVEVMLDNRTLGHIPLPGAAHPLRLAPGRHVFTWRSHLLPFDALHCTISVPEQVFDSCATVSSYILARSGLTLSGSVLAMHESQLALPDAGSDLSVAIAQALYAARSTALVQPGEHYYAQVGQSYTPEPVVATQPLRATLTYEHISNFGGPEPCAFRQDQTIPCRFPGQDCSQLCTVPDAALPGVDTTHEWVVAADVEAAWQYATLDGHVIASTSEAFRWQLVVLRISWDGSAWHVTPILGHTPGLDVTDDAACDPARGWLNGTTWYFMLSQPPLGAKALFASDANPVDGCVVVLEHGGPAVFLERFGLLLTVNAAARNPTDNLPSADSGEQALAQRLMAQLQL